MPHTASCNCGWRVEVRTLDELRDLDAQHVKLHADHPDWDISNLPRQPE